MLSEVPEPEPLQGLVEGSFVSVCKEDLRASERMPADFLCDGGLCHEVAEGGEGSWASDGGGDLGTAFTMVEKARQRQVLEATRASEREEFEEQPKVQLRRSPRRHRNVDTKKDGGSGGDWVVCMCVGCAVA